MDLEAFLARVLLVIVMITNPQVQQSVVAAVAAYSAAVSQYSKGVAKVHMTQAKHSGDWGRRKQQDNTPKHRRHKKVTLRGGLLCTHTHYQIDSSVKNQFSTWQRFGKKSRQINQPLFICLISDTYPFTFRRNLQITDFVKPQKNHTAETSQFNTHQLLVVSNKQFLQKMPFNMPVM